MIYAGFAALAVWQALPGQRTRRVHRDTGWWLAGAAVLNALWIVLFTQRLVIAAEVVIVGLLVSLAVVAVRLRVPAEGWADRVLLRLPVAIYLGWVTVATVAGAATTTTAFNAAPTPAVAVAVLLLTGVAVALALSRLSSVVALAAAVCWPLVWIAVGTSVGSVRAVALVAAVIVVAAVVVRLVRSSSPKAVAWG
ncbi:hypothetical protein GCM10029964_062840 [Kibdelosporangium lantanae]